MKWLHTLWAYLTDRPRNVLVVAVDDYTSGSSLSIAATAALAPHIADGWRVASTAVLRTEGFNRTTLFVTLVK